MSKTLLEELKKCEEDCGTNKTAFYDDIRCIIDKYDTQHEDNTMGTMPPTNRLEESFMGVTKSELLGGFTNAKIELSSHAFEDDVDPNGIGAHDGGTKLDAGKNQLGSILGDFSNALMAVGEVGSLGAQKYSLGDWKLVPEGQRRYTDAMLRHFFKESNSLYDDELPVLHAAQVAWNALARLEFIIKDLKDETK